MEYNSVRPNLIIPEYGRNIHKMIAFALTVEDREERNHVARSIVKVMGQVNPQYKENEDFTQKLWDHLFVISDFKLDVDSPFPMPKPEDLAKKPNKMAYPNTRIRYRHYGEAVEKFIAKAIAMEPGEEKDNFTYYIANLMKKDYLQYNRESVSDDLILEQLEQLSDGALKLKEGFSLRGTNEILGKSRGTAKSPQRKPGGSNNGKKRHNNNNNNNNKRRR